MKRYLLPGIFVFSFILNFLWESLHSAFLYTCCDFAIKKYVSVMTYVSFMDSLLILALYLVIAGLWKDIFWIRTMNRKQIYTYLILSFLVAAFIEARAMMFNLWTYSDLMPTIFGLGVSPLIQLSVTGLLVFWLMRLLLKKVL